MPKNATLDFHLRWRFFCSYQSETVTAKPPLKKYVFVQYTFGGTDGS